MVQYVQGQVGGSNSTEEERTVDSLYIGQADNGSGHWVFKLDTKQPISVNIIPSVPMLADFMDRINKMGKEDNVPDGIQIGDVEGNLTILYFLKEAGDDDINASDESFKHNKSYQKEFDDQLKEESHFMKTTVDKDKLDGNNKTQGEYISHEEQKYHFFKPPNRVGTILRINIAKQEVTNMVRMTAMNWRAYNHWWQMGMMK